MLATDDITPSPDARTIRLLHIEDSPVDAAIFKRLFKRNPECCYDITHVKSLAEAEDQLSGHRFDAVLTDMSLGDAQGLELVHAVVHKAREIPVVVATGSDDNGLGMALMREGAAGYLIKGQINSQVLARALDQAIARTQAMAVAHSSTF